MLPSANSSTNITVHFMLDILQSSLFYCSHFHAIIERCSHENGQKCWKFWDWPIVWDAIQRHTLRERRPSQHGCLPSLLSDRTPFICTLSVLIHLSFNSQQGPPLSSLSDAIRETRLTTSLSFPLYFQNLQIKIYNHRFNFKCSPLGAFKFYSVRIWNDQLYSFFLKLDIKT